MCVLDYYRMLVKMITRNRRIVNRNRKGLIHLQKKIVVLGGSPRKQGNTAALIAAFQAGAEGAGHTVTVFHLDSMDIHGCKGCYQGGKDALHPCVQRDDMDKIYPAYQAADVVVLASPLYFWNLSGQLRTAFDRLFAVAEGNPGYQSPKKQCALLMAAEGNEFEDCITYYDHLMGHLGWQDLGKVLCGGVVAVGDIQGRKELEDARALGASV